jgi:hypothetical protein
MTRTRGSSGRPNRPGQRGRRSRKLSAAQAAIAAAVIGALGTVTAASVGAFDKPATSEPTASESVVPKASPPSPSSQGTQPSGPLIPGDNSSFVADVTYPDGSAVTEGQHLMKKWEIKNIGIVLWSNRYLVADGTQTGLCTYPSRVPIPLTRPGQNVIISVPVTASDSPDVCFVTWKMETSTGTLYFPNEVGIWFSIKVNAGFR